MKNFTILSNIYFSLKKYEEFIKNFLVNWWKLFFCKKSNNKPSCQIKSFFFKKKKRKLTLVENKFNNK